MHNIRANVYDNRRVQGCVTVMYAGGGLDIMFVREKKTTKKAITKRVVDVILSCDRFARQPYHI